MKNLILLTILVSTPVLAKKKLKAKDLSFKLDATSVNDESYRNSDFIDSYREKASSIGARKYPENYSNPAVPSGSVFTKFNPETQSWERN